jgi:hypothetical protein
VRMGAGVADDGCSGVFVGVPGEFLAVQLCFLMAAAGILVGNIYAAFERINDPGHAVSGWVAGLVGAGVGFGLGLTFTLVVYLWPRTQAAPWRRRRGCGQ